MRSTVPWSPSRSIRRVALLWVFLGILSCGDSTGPEGPAPPASLSAVEGPGVRAPAGTVIPQGPTVEVRDAKREPVVNGTVVFSVVSGGGQIVETSVTTDSRGLARGTWILGRDPSEPQTLRATAGDLTVDISADAFPPEAGANYLGRKQFTEYLAGSLPLVITAPHGGDIEPVEIPNRGYGVTGTDRNTRDLALRIRQALYDRTGAYPHLVISHLHRIKLDPNREIVEAAQGNWEAERAWWEYHTFADEAGEAVEDRFGRGFYLDIHGHGHEIDRVELGYLLSSSDLVKSDPELSGPTYVARSSVAALVASSGASLADLVRGPYSLGTLLEERGIPAVPSQPQPDPAGAAFFSGGYSTARHGSRDGGNISGVQLEHHYPGLRNEAQNRQAYAEILADALIEFFPIHFGFELAEAQAPSSQS